MGKSQRRKGQRGELRARDILRAVYPDAYRSANQAGSDACCDVEGTPWWCEAKEGKTHRIWAAVRQAVEARTAAKDDRPIVVISHRTRGMTLAVVPWESWQAEITDPHTYLREHWSYAVKWEDVSILPTRVRGGRPDAPEVVVMRAADFVEMLKR